MSKKSVLTTAVTLIILAVVIIAVGGLGYRVDQIIQADQLELQALQACKQECSPYAHQIIENECHCAELNGWMKSDLHRKTYPRE